MTGRIVTQPIRFDDGREGTQTVRLYSDGDVELLCVHITRTADGRRCDVVYDQSPDIRAKIFALVDIRGEWSLAK